MNLFIDIIGYKTLFVSIYIVSALSSSFYFKKTGRSWWYGLFSPIIGGLVLAISIYIFGTINILIFGGPTLF